MPNVLAIEPKEVAVINRRRSIEVLEQAINQQADNCTQELLDNTKHHFCEGVYAREFFLPKDHACTGRVHKTACFNVLLSGKITITSGEMAPTEMEAPAFFVSAAGEKKALYAHEDTVFITFHATEETDPAKMLDLFTVPTVKAFESYKRELLEDKSQ